MLNIERYRKEDDHTLLIDLPDFESGTKYKGMKLSKSYTPEDLGL